MGIWDQGLNLRNAVADGVFGLDLQFLFLFAALFFEWENLACCQLDNQALLGLQFLSWDLLKIPYTILGELCGQLRLLGGLIGARCLYVFVSVHV